MFFRFILVIVLLKTITCTDLIVSLSSSQRGGILGHAADSFKLGFNNFFVPIQETRDAYPRLLVSTENLISNLTMLQVSENEKIEPISLGEFLANTAQTIQKMSLPIKTPKQLDTILHNFYYSPRNTTDFDMVLVIDKETNITTLNQISEYYKKMVPEGIITLYDPDFIFNFEHNNSIQFTNYATNINYITEELLNKYKEINFGALDLNMIEHMKKAIHLGVKFFTTQEPEAYIYNNRTKTQGKKGHVSIVIS